MSPFGALRSVGSLGQSVGLSRDELEVYVSNYTTLQVARAAIVQLDQDLFHILQYIRRLRLVPHENRPHCPFRLGQG